MRFEGQYKNTVSAQQILAQISRVKPSASFALKADPNDPYHFSFLIQNHSEVSLNCWCNLNATVYGQAISLGGFYSGQSSFDLQPFSVGTGHFNIRDILRQANRTPEELKQRVASSNPKEQLYLNIELWYNPLGENLVIRNPRQPHYFDFAHDVLLADF